MQHDDSNSLLVLLVDSDPARARSVSLELERAGFEFTLAAGWEAARERVQQDLPEAILIDGELLVGQNDAAARSFLERQNALPTLAILRTEEAWRPLDSIDDWVRDPISALILKERVHAAVASRERKLELANAMTSMSVLQSLGRMGAWRLVPASGELYCTEAACQLLDIEFYGKAMSPDVLLASVTEANQPEVRAWLETLFSGQATGAIEYQLECADGALRRLRLRADKPVEAEDGASIAGIIQDCSKGLTPIEAVEHVNTNDPITGLPNRKQFLQSLDRAINTAFDTQEQIAILFIEVEADSVRGMAPPEEENDSLLIKVVQRLKEDLREFDMLGQPGADVADLGLSRVGNQTLTLLLRDQTRSQDAYKVARRIRQNAEQTFVLDGRDIKVNFNIGIAVYPGDAESALGLVKCAEQAMHGAKQQGQNNIQFNTTAMNTATFESLTLEASLRRALERDELTVYYQPKVNISSNKIIGMEALVRWRHPELGMVSPAQFIPIAEETGLIIPIGEFVLRTACQQNKAWQDMGLEPVCMAVNLSSVQFRRTDLFDKVIGILDEVRLDPSWLELEITESILLRNVDATITTLHRLKRAGIHLSIDDFGTGYSSLSYLKRFPVDTLKIDQSFIREVTSNADDASITTSIILMGHSLKLKVIAEGVETKSQLAFLRVLECDEVQGYYFSPPVPSEAATKLLEGVLAKESL